MNLRTDVDWVLDREQIKRLLWPVAWSGTKDKSEAEEEEAELHTLAREALEALDEAELHWEFDGELTVRFDKGEVAEIVAVV